MQSNDPLMKTIVSAVALLLLLYVVAVPFYMHFEKNWSFIDTVYFVTTTICTVGYGDMYPTTDITRVFTIFLMFTGVSIFFYHITHFGQFKERSIDPHVQRRLEMLRNLTALQTGDVKHEQIKKIKEKMGNDRSRDFGRL